MSEERHHAEPDPAEGSYELQDNAEDAARAAALAAREQWAELGDRVWGGASSAIIDDHRFRMAERQAMIDQARAQTDASYED